MSADTRSWISRALMSTARAFARVPACSGHSLKTAFSITSYDVLVVTMHSREHTGGTGLAKARDYGNKIGRQIFCKQFRTGSIHMLGVVEIVSVVRYSAI